MVRPTSSKQKHRPENEKSYRHSCRVKVCLLPLPSSYLFQPGQNPVCFPFQLGAGKVLIQQGAYRLRLDSFRALGAG
jgi:hypothetical protein